MNLKKLIGFILILLALNVNANVIITGKITNAKAGKIILRKHTLFLTDYTPNVIYSSAAIADSFYIELPIKKARLITFYCSGNKISQEIFVTPGDKINFIIDENGIKFFGKNSGAYNFLAQMAKVIDNRKTPYFKKYPDFSTYKTALIDWFNKKRDFLNNYSKTELLSAEAIKFFKEDIDYDYNFNLNSPIADASISKEKMPSDYLDNAITFNKDYLIDVNSDYGGAVIRKYMYVAFSDPYNNCNEVYKNAISKLNGKTRDYFISNMIGLFVENAPQQNRESLLKIINLEKKIIKDTTYLKYINEQEVKLLILNQKLPSTILDKTLLTNYDGTQLSLRELLALHKDKAVYIDFWASWCFPCREDIKNSADAKAMINEKGAIYLYFSVDKDKEAWKKASEEDKIEQNQFLIIDGLKSQLATFIEIAYIPRYIFLDENHIVKSIYAPRPTAIANLKKMLNPPVVTKY